MYKHVGSCHHCIYFPVAIRRVDNHLPLTLSIKRLTVRACFIESLIESN